MKNVLITGGSGLIGKHLCKKLAEKGFSVSVLSRNNFTKKWNSEHLRIIKNTDCIIHLAGANIAEKRWTNKRKKIIVESRVNTAQLIYETLKQYPPKTFITASAVGYYGATTSEKIFTETDFPADDFLGTTCSLWEQASELFKEQRVVKIRTGVVLAKHGGALLKMLAPVKLGIGSAIGNGKQYLPWVHIDDLCEIYIKAITDSQMHGAYNAVAPDFVTNKEFMKTLANILKKPFWFPNVPSAVLKLLFGEMSEMLLKGSRVSPQKIINAGFKFQFPDLEKALENLL